MSDDFELLKRWKDGDKAAGNELVDRHFSSVYRFFRSKIDSDVEDLTQRTFLASLESFDRIKEGTFRAYLLGIARHLLFHQYRNKRTHGKLEDFMEVSAEDLMGTPSQLRAMHEEKKLLLKGLRSIPIDFQICVELHYWEGMGVADIAAVLGVQTGTVKSRLFRARQMLRERIEAMHVSDQLIRSTIDDLDRWAAALQKDFGQGGSDGDEG
ncbi:MAG: RNA polymerase sigma factor [Nannocystaceae bacterium]|nr:RNA polymerase sigma factor [Nannocystaceae bacterium]